MYQEVEASVMTGSNLGNRNERRASLIQLIRKVILSLLKREGLAARRASVGAASGGLVRTRSVPYTGEYLSAELFYLSGRK